MYPKVGFRVHIDENMYPKVGFRVHVAGESGRGDITKRVHKSHIRHKSNFLIFGVVDNEYSRLITLPSHKIYTQTGTY